MPLVSAKSAVHNKFGRCCAFTYSTRLEGCNIPDIDIVIQWNAPAKLSNFVQRAGRTARGTGRIGITILLVEPSLFTTLPLSDKSPPAANASKQNGAKGKKPGRNAKRGPSVKVGKRYGQAHGLRRGSANIENDHAPTGEQPELDVEASDEGLSVFIQSVECRRKVWAKVFDTESTLTGAPCIFC